MNPVVVVTHGGRREMEPQLDGVVRQEADEEYWNNVTELAILPKA